MVFVSSEKGSLVQRSIWLATITLPLLVSTLKGAGPAPIQTVTIKPNGAFSVNNRPFFPLVGWLQNAENLPIVR